MTAPHLTLILSPLEVARREMLERLATLREDTAFYMDPDISDKISEVEKLVPRSRTFSELAGLAVPIGFIRQEYGV